MSKYIIFLVKSFLGNFYRHLAIFSGHTGLEFNYDDTIDRGGWRLTSVTSLGDL